MHMQDDSPLASQRLARGLLVLAVIVGGAAPVTAHAQPADDALDPALAAFKKHYAQLKALETDYRNLLAEFRAAPAEKRTELRDKARALDKRAETIFASLLEVTPKAYQAAPNKNKDVTDAMLMLAFRQMSRDRYEEARRLTEMLIKNNAQTRRLYDIAGSAAFALNDFEAAEKHLTKAKEQGQLSPTGERRLAQIPAVKPLWKQEREIRKKEAQADNLPRVKLETSAGDIVVELFEDQAPKTVANFVHLAEKGYYDGIKFHRVLPGFMAQTGDPKGDGTGGPGYRIPGEASAAGARKHFRGSLSMALSSDPATGKALVNSGGSQFYITFLPTPHLNDTYTVFGRVISGFDVLSKLKRVDPTRPALGVKPDVITKATVLRKRDHEYQPTKVE